MDPDTEDSPSPPALDGPPASAWQDGFMLYGDHDPGHAEVGCWCVPEDVDDPWFLWY